jgi:hypothetical protein
MTIGIPIRKTGLACIAIAALLLGPAGARAHRRAATTKRPGIESRKSATASRKPVTENRRNAIAKKKLAIVHRKGSTASRNFTTTAARTWTRTATTKPNPNLSSWRI